MYGNVFYLRESFHFFVTRRAFAAAPKPLPVPSYRPSTLETSSAAIGRMGGTKSGKVFLGIDCPRAGCQTILALIRKNTFLEKI